MLFRSGTVLDMIKGENDITFDQDFYEGVFEDENSSTDSLDEGIKVE